MLTTVEKVLFLKGIEIFSAVKTEALAYIASIAEELKLEDGEEIFREKTPADALYIVLEGKARLVRGETEIAVVEQGEPIGIWSLFDDEPRLASAVAQGPMVVLRIDRDDFYDVLGDHVEIAQAMFKSLVQRLRELVG
jgi:CRP/FNR family cyclic AMP-dependent transcriptional regulator